MTTPPHIRQIVDEVSKMLAAEGKLIEAGFVGYRKFVMSPDAPQIQIDECRFAFFAGAQHLFASINSIMGSNQEPTENDMRRMDQMHAELQKFAKELELRVNKGRT
jgi:hypothetical protein